MISERPTVELLPSSTPAADIAGPVPRPRPSEPSPTAYSVTAKKRARTQPEVSSCELHEVSDGSVTLSVDGQLIKVSTDVARALAHRILSALA